MSQIEPLQAAEARVLGVLIEKSLTTPDGYPLSLNALVNGCNQKSNRHPVTSFDEVTVEAAVRDLRMNRLVQEFGSTGARVPKFGHRAAERLELSQPELAVVAELLMRGPQTAGELRGRASRMAPIASLAELQPVVDGLVARGFVAHLPPAAGSRAGRLVQTLAPGLHGDETPSAAPPRAASTRASAAPAAPSLIDRDELLASILHECDVAKHLVGCLPADRADERMTPGQRSHLEVARYLAFCAIGGTLFILDGDFDGYHAWQAKTEALSLAQLPAAFDAQKAALREAFARIQPSDYEREIKHPAGHTLTLKRALLELPLKWMVGYRMQLFLCAKLAGNADIGTSDCWHGRAKQPAG